MKIQQGDVILTKLSKMPIGNFKTKSKNKCVLAEGEHTGHYHAVEDDEAELIADGDRILLLLGKQGVLEHQEHKPITLEPGIWEVGQINEYDYFSEMARKVVD